jgi:hypothetical protein
MLYHLGIILFELEFLSLLTEGVLMNIGSIKRLLYGYRASVQDEEKVLEMDGG